MIRTSRQLKDKIRNLSKGNSDRAQLLIRNYGMERFLERVSLSGHKDIDTTVRNMPLNVPTDTRRIAVFLLIAFPPALEYPSL